MTDPEGFVQFVLVMVGFATLLCGTLFVTTYYGWKETAERAAKRNATPNQDTACRDMRSKNNLSRSCLSPVSPELLKSKEPEFRRRLTTKKLIHRLQCQVANLSDDVRRESHKSDYEGSFGSPWLF